MYAGAGDRLQSVCFRFAGCWCSRQAYAVGPWPDASVNGSDIGFYKNPCSVRVPDALVLLKGCSTSEAFAHERAGSPGLCCQTRVQHAHQHEDIGSRLERHSAVTPAALKDKLSAS